MQTQAEQAARAVDITVTVNRRPVVFARHEATGTEIEQTAITQGVPIQLDFLLFEEAGESEQLKRIGDAQTVVLHRHEAFLAVAPDDNS